MNRILTGIAIGGAAFFGAQALAGDAPGQSTSKRQMVKEVITCVKGRMSSSRTISYNEAFKSCREQVRNPSAIGSSDTLVAADSPKP